MVSKREDIAALISSVMDYMVNYKFQGVDLGWKYPGDTTRGGRKLADTHRLRINFFSGWFRFSLRT
jgi:GH18 family chitinase